MYILTTIALTFYNSLHAMLCAIARNNKPAISEGLAIYIFTNVLVSMKYESKIHDKLFKYNKLKSNILHLAIDDVSLVPVGKSHYCIVQNCNSFFFQGRTFAITKLLCMFLYFGHQKFEI